MSNLSAWLDASGNSDAPSRSLTDMAHWLGCAEKAPSPGTHSPTPPTSSPWGRLTTIATLAGRIAAELESNPSRLLTLNPSRREAIARHLESLCGNSCDESFSSIQKWVTGPRGPKQNSAFRKYFEEVARIFLGQVILMKAWSDRGIRIAEESDLNNLNWALSSTLRPFVPLDREGWQLTSRNLYSWYTPEPTLQQEIWRGVSGIKLGEESPEILFRFLESLDESESTRRPAGQKLRYDNRFFQAIWKNLQTLNVPNSVIDQSRKIFCPTLRDGTFLHGSSAAVSVCGFEQNTYDLLTAELVQLWWGPATPPMWAQGNGLEELKRDQLQFKLTPAKPTLSNQIAEMEAFEGGFVFEESCVRYTSFKSQVDTISQWKGLRSPGATLGMFQALLSLSKIRPHGILIYVREEPLKAQDGQSLLAAFLDKSCLVAEVDFSSLVLPRQQTDFPLPKFVYIFKRETDFQTRLNHKPMRIAVRGQLRSQVELPGLLDQVMRTIGSEAIQADDAQSQIQKLPSHLTQRDWMTHWPDAAEPETLLELDHLSARSLPLASLATIKGVSAHDMERLSETKAIGLFASVAQDGQQSPLVVQDLARLTSTKATAGFQILLPDQRWVAPIRSYLLSGTIKTWIHFKADKKNDRYVLNESFIKFLPIPKTILAELNGQAKTSTEWEKTCSDLGNNPNQVQKTLEAQSTSGPGLDADLAASLFSRASRWHHHWEAQIHQIGKLTKKSETPSASICWRQLMTVLPASERVAAAMHSDVKISGKLPPHIPIGKIEKVKLPSPGILFMTESGLNLHLAVEHSRQINILMDQMADLKCPTWNELCQILFLPRRLEIAEAMAADVLRELFAAKAKAQALQSIMDDCLRRI